MHIVIVGASVAGIRTAQALRVGGFDGTITVVGDEPHSPYDKPPLSKEILDPASDRDSVSLIDADALASLSVDLRLGVRATAVDIDGKLLSTDSLGQIAYDTLVIATGMRPRTLFAAEHFSNVYTIRSLDDSRAIRAELSRGRRAAVIGAGFIGAEFASAARAHGVEVTLIEAQDAPMAAQLSAEVGTALAELHSHHGVEMITGLQPHGFGGSTRATSVTLSDGRRVPADFVVVGIGATPAVEWLDTAGLVIDDGVRCDETLKALGCHDIYAAGDVAHWDHPMYGEPLRIEHWTNANDHAEIVAADILGTTAPRPTLPYVWSDQYGHRIQIIGRPALGSPTIRTGAATHGDLVVGYTDADDVLVGALVVDNPRLLMKLRRAVLAGEHRHEAEATILEATPAAM
ncbi:NAD(P)/FAD-dependent oxidoreductase [Gordonia aichiensis]|uniref:p-cumate dioxygenase ferredoxin reductase subunit n=1 Tax=Gordonia aichiensis NBRC 108223 TaxID=1220583 RepID=L7KNR7_9ACTN|nr:FAD-dependent oxidoreductase [Gordonia aichiensis]GAC49353.1 p-cumate dioxygenase ferredoxin reductase subunit [Gordonia aichiensis NBRC 108223]